MDYNKHEPEEHDELPPFTSEVERDELTAPSQAATPMTAEERARGAVSCARCCSRVACAMGKAVIDCPRVAVAAAIRTAVNEAIEKAAKELEDTGRHEVLAYEVASRLRFHKLPSPSPEKEGTNGQT